MKKILLIVLFITGVCFGQTHEFAEEFYKNGIPKVIKTYKESNDKYELVKFISLYENGQKEKENTYKDGKLNGKWTEWHSNGQKSKEGTYKDGLNNGNWTEWYNNGQKKIEEAYKDGKLDGKTIRWYENGQKAIEGAYKDGKLNGKWIRWADDGSLTIKLTFQDGKISDTEINAFKSLLIINGRFDCFDGSKSVQASWVNDNECDCNDCSDEPLRQPNY
ncbi:MAG: toxin-antitoxin system YwqK family antitoxin [Candidatus Marinimicrobia bacterium]|nr:toxin-antitoxin system YwqK family antitoxin [Candidatus Neomarinimicrobiota bacterium]